VLSSPPAPPSTRWRWDVERCTNPYRDGFKAVDVEIGQETILDEDDVASAQREDSGNRSPMDRRGLVEASEVEDRPIKVWILESQDEPFCRGRAELLAEDRVGGG
jgi:hypothetical protein